jgi:hypothetical protein
MEGWKVRINGNLKFHYSNLPIFLFLKAVLLVHVGDAAKEGHGFPVAFISHAVNFHGGDEDEIVRSQDLFPHDLVRLGIMLKAAHVAGQNVHGLIIKMIVNGDFSFRADGEIPEAVFDRIFGAGLGEPPDPNILHRIGFPLVGIGLNLLVFFVVDIHHDHGFSPFP